MATAKQITCTSLAVFVPLVKLHEQHVLQIAVKQATKEAFKNDARV